MIIRKLETCPKCGQHDPWRKRRSLVVHGEGRVPDPLAKPHFRMIGERGTGNGIRKHFRMTKKFYKFKRGKWRR